MTDINGKPPPPVVPSQAKTIDTRTGDFLSGSSSRHQQGNAFNNQGSNHRSNSSVLVSQSAFETLLQTTQQRQDREYTDESSDQETPEEQPQLLFTLTPEKNSTKDQPTVSTPQAADRSAKVEEVAKLVTRQIDAALRPSPMVNAQPLSLSLQLDPSTGLKGIQVEMIDGVLAVTLTRATDQAGQDIQQAALNLAQILQSRFPTKTIKVSEKFEELGIEVEDTSDTNDPLTPRVATGPFSAGDGTL